jgi:hypothetical protein
MRGEELAKKAGDGTRKTKDQEREGLGVETERGLFGISGYRNSWLQQYVEQLTQKRGVEQK